MFAAVTLLLTVFFIYISRLLQRLKEIEWVSQFSGPGPVLPIVGNGLEMAGHPMSK